jgi:bifunctional oligoribonuclease and PAP phosphatase NrnA
MFYKDCVGHMHEAPGELLEALKLMRSPVLVTHVVPDADALGSMLGLARAWSQQSVKVWVSVPVDSLSQRLSFLADLAGMPVASNEDFAVADGFVVLDTARKSRCNVGPDLRETDWSAGRPVVVIDHHETSTRFGDVNWVVDSAGSTAELVYYLLRTLGWPIDAPTASLLYSGILTDLLGFSLPTTTSAALYAAAELVASGADIGDLGERLLRSQRQSEFDLLRVIYANTRRDADGALAYSSASFEEIRSSGCSAADIDDQINVPRSLDGVRLAMLFTEGKPGKTRINFRGSGNVTVSDLAAKFNGGGHSQAAGAVLDCGLDEAIRRVLPCAVEYLKSFPLIDGSAGASPSQEGASPSHRAPNPPTERIT